MVDKLKWPLEPQGSHICTKTRHAQQAPSIPLSTSWLSTQVILPDAMFSSNIQVILVLGTYNIPLSNSYSLNFSKTFIFHTQILCSHVCNNCHGWPGSLYMYLPNKLSHFGATHSLLFTFSSGCPSPGKILVTSVPPFVSSDLEFLQTSGLPFKDSVSAAGHGAQDSYGHQVLKGRAYKKLCRSQSEFHMIPV